MTDRFDVLREPLRLGALDLPHRLVMAPLTRNRADEDGTPNALMAEYYGQRAGSAALIVSEATWVSQQGKPYPRTPGIATDAHRDGWRLVTDAVHESGGLIVAQLWHGGRVGHPDTSGQDLVSASDVAPAELTIFTPNEAQASIPAPRPLTLDELPGIVADFRDAAVRAIEAGFDGVEIHGANGYLLQQFLADNTNHRDDAYGGSAENRARLVAEIAAAVSEAIGADRTGIRLSPLAPAHEMAEADGGDTYRALAPQLRALGLAYVHLLAQPEDALTAELRRSRSSRTGTPTPRSSAAPSSPTRTSTSAGRSTRRRTRRSRSSSTPRARRATRTTRRWRPRRRSGPRRAQPRGGTCGSDAGASAAARFSSRTAAHSSSR
jgi:N-ethylmaleimide reductase